MGVWPLGKHSEASIMTVTVDGLLARCALSHTATTRPAADETMVMTLVIQCWQHCHWRALFCDDSPPA